MCKFQKGTSVWLKRPSPPRKRPVHTAKEACAHSKRGLCTQQKRPVHTAKEACHTGIPVPHPQHPVSREEAEAAEAVETLVLPVGLTNV